MTMKYTHIGLQDQADALAGLRLTKICTSADWTGIGRVSGDVLGKEDSAGDSEGDCEDEPENEKTPSGEGVSSCCVSASQDLAVDVSSGGGGNCTCVPRIANYFPVMPLRKSGLLPAGKWLGAVGVT